MTTKPKPKPDDPAQSKRFIDTAREVETNASPEEFDRVFKIVVKNASPVQTDKES